VTGELLAWHNSHALILHTHYTPTRHSGYATQAKSSIISIGLTIHNTPVELREKLAVPEAEWPRAIEELCSYPHIEEAGILSTCNRLELYVVAVSWHRGVREVRLPQNTIRVAHLTARISLHHFVMTLVSPRVYPASFVWQWNCQCNDYDTNTGKFPSHPCNQKLCLLFCPGGGLDEQV